MHLLVGITLSGLMFSVCENRVYLDQTEDGRGIESYDCVIAQDLPFCRRPRDLIDLRRDDYDPAWCSNNGGILYHFTELRSMGTNISGILHTWKSSLERVELYARYLRQPSSSDADGYICQCIDPSSFGKHCEYRLPMGTTLSETLERQSNVKTMQPWTNPMENEMLCYETLGCNSNLLCLDWREVCDGTQNCLDGADEENCDLLELNTCAAEEYRCMNGMCIPDEYFLDGQFDCLDKSDELPYTDMDSCPWNSASIECDDHLCPLRHWSCGDGQCLADRFPLQKKLFEQGCVSHRDRYYMCETHPSINLWTLPNGRCDEYGKGNTSQSHNRTNASSCEFLLRCALFDGENVNCPCRTRLTCAIQLKDMCPMQLIPYPRRPIIAPSVLFLYDPVHVRQSKLPSFIRVDGTIRCRGSMIPVNETVPVHEESSLHRIMEELCASAQTVTNSSECSNTDSSTDLCHEANQCLSSTRLNDGLVQCVNGKDEYKRSEIESDWGCAGVRRHRWRCSKEHPTCLSIMAFDHFQRICSRIPDQLSALTSRGMTSIKCNARDKEECSLLRRLIERSSTDTNKNELQGQQRIPFRSYCDTFFDLPSMDDENLDECQQRWICDGDQWRERCRGTGQCLTSTWRVDLEWDCADGSDMDDLLEPIMEAVKSQADQIDLYANTTYFLPQTCHASSVFACFAATRPHQPIVCLNRSQLGDRKIDCTGAIDERNTLPHCSEPSALGSTFLCLSTNTCIPFAYHCQADHRCPNRMDDEVWCSKKQPEPACEDPHAFMCSDGICVSDTRCDLLAVCSLGEDEYMCDLQYIATKQLLLYRKAKRLQLATTPKIFRLPRFPLNVNATAPHRKISSTRSTTRTTRSISSSTASVAFQCNRGVGIWSPNRSIVCFCPPQYYGHQCQYHADRLLVLLHLNLSRSVYTTNADPQILLRLLVTLSFHNRTLGRGEFQVRPAFEITGFRKKLLYFPYSHSDAARQQRRQRFTNRSALLHSRPCTLRIEAYETSAIKRPTLMAWWEYPIEFDYVPVYRFARVLRWPLSDHLRSSCHSLNCTDSHDRCEDGYCAPGSLCRSDARSADGATSSPPPYCICTANRHGKRCELQHDSCNDQPCLNGGSCFPTAQLNEVDCWCQEEYYGSRCEWRKASIRLSVDENATYAGAVVQFFDLDLVSVSLNLVHQRVYSSLPPVIEYHRERETIPPIVVAKLYGSYDDDEPELYLLSVQSNVKSLDGTTEISQSSHCPSVQTLPLSTLFGTAQNLSPIRYHHLCRNLTQRLCFYDDIYLCICLEGRVRAECFLYDHQLDQCEHCLGGGRCLAGNHGRSNDFLCLCLPCHSGEQCQFSSKSFTFTLDQLLYTDLISKDNRKTIALLLFFSLLGFLLAIPNNLFSFVTFRRRPCRRNGIGHYLLWLSIINQINLGLFVARLIQIIFNIATSSSASVVDNILCKSLNYLLLSTSRMVFWFSSLVAIERLYTTLILNGHWFKQPRIARRLILFVSIGVLSSSFYEFLFHKSLLIANANHRWICMFDIPVRHQSFWMISHLLISTLHSLFPFLINLCSMITISIVVVNKKITALRTKRTVRFVLNVLRENKELVIGPGVTLIPQLFALPLVIFSFSLDCQNIENSWLRYLLIASYWTSFTPQMISFFLYISPSSLYASEWRKTKIGRWLTRVRVRHPAAAVQTALTLTVASWNLNRTRH